MVWVEMVENCRGEFLPEESESLGWMAPATGLPVTTWLTSTAMRRWFPRSSGPNLPQMKPVNIQSEKARNDLTHHCYEEMVSPEFSPLNLAQMILANIQSKKWYDSPRLPLNGFTGVQFLSCQQIHINYYLAKIEFTFVHVVSMWETSSHLQILPVCWLYIGWECTMHMGNMITSQDGNRL